MSNPIRCASLCAIALLACSTEPAASSPASPEEADSDPTTTITAVRDARAPSLGVVGDEDAIALGSAAVIAPARGEGAGIALHGTDGTTTWLEVLRDEAGAARVVEQIDQMRTLSSGSPPACKDGAYKLEGFAWKKPYAWWFKAGSTPTSTSAAKAESTLRWAAGAITSGRNDCGLPDAISASHVYQGRTTRGTNVVATSTSVTCGKRDGVNVVAYGVLPSSYLGVTCYWYDATGALEADVKLNDHYHRWFTGTSVPSACTSAFSLASVAVHEFGHAFGLGHVPEATHANLTMSPVTGPCTMGPATLGRGDVLGLRAKY